MSKRKEIIETHTGLKMLVVQEGSGPRPSRGDTVIIHYELALGEGVSTSNYDYDNECYVDSLVDSTYEVGPYSGPIKVTIGRHTPKDCLYTKGESVEGLDAGLLQMRTGEKRRLIIPAALAYGEEGASSFHSFHGYRTPPGVPLDMTVELVGIADAGEGEVNVEKE